MTFIPEVILKYILESEKENKGKSGVLKKEWVLAILKELAPEASKQDIMMASDTIDVMVQALNIDWKKIKKGVKFISVCCKC